MSVIYVARSTSLAKWGASVGISKNLFKVGVSQGSAKDAVAALNAEECARATDWKLVKAEDAGDLAEEEALDRLSARETALDPKYYPRVKDATGIFRVRPENVENSMLVEKAMAGAESLTFNVKPTDIATYLIRNAKS